MPKNRLRNRQSLRGKLADKPVSLAPTPWDHSTAQQRKQRPHVVQERGEADPKTGKMVNPNGITGVRYLRTIEALTAQGVLPEYALAAAGDYASLARAVRGSPAQRSCLDFSPVGHEGDVDDPQAERNWRDWRTLQRLMGMLADAELSRMLWEQDGDGDVLDLGALRRGLQVVAEYYGRA